MQFVKDLSNLTQLRVLRTGIMSINDIIESDLLQSIGKLRRIQRPSLHIFGGKPQSSTWCAQLVLPRGLRYLNFSALHMEIMPPCINPSHLVNLSDLNLLANGMDRQDLESLSRLPQLRHLWLQTMSTVTLPNVASNGCFQMLRSCCFPWSTVRFMLNGDSSVSFTIWNGRDDVDFVSSRKEEDEERVAAPAVMPNLRELEFNVIVRALVDYRGCCDLLGLEYLISLQKITAKFCCYDTAKEVAEEEKAALRRVVEAHPNHPILKIKYSI